jgi:hypothetical protein
VRAGPDRHLAAIREFRDAGFDHLALVGVRPDQEGFLRFWRDEPAARLRAEGRAQDADYVDRHRRAASE